MDYIIRNETEKDFRQTEELVKRAFWNVNAPGANEHYLAHILRTHPDFIKDLDFVIEKDGKIIASIMYTKAKLIDENGVEKQICSFGPICVDPTLQRKGYGKILIEHSFEKAKKLGFDTVAIFGHPSNYVARGFVSCKKHNIYVGDHYFPTALLVKELKENSLDGRAYQYEESKAFELDEKDVEEFDKSFPFIKKEYKPCQEEFWIYCRSSIQGN